MVEKRSAEWMFEDWPDGSLVRSGQIIRTFQARFMVVAVFSWTLPMMRFIDRRLTRDA